MKLNFKSPRDFINPLLSKKNNVSSEKFEEFKILFSKYKRDIDAQHAGKQSEPNIVTNVLKPFVDALGYETNSHSQKGQSGIDLSILKDNKPAVIFEVKKYKSSDMISCNNLNTKAFHEAVLYFMREREKGNSALYHIIITDFYDWFVFDAKDFDRYFWNDNTIRKLFNIHINPSLLDNKTGDFYKSLSKAIGNIKTDFFEDEIIDCAYFEVISKKNERELLAIYKLLSPDSLLKEFNPNDANSLNREFYNELLYILGLEELKNGGNKIIGRSKNIQGGVERFLKILAIS